MTANTFATEDLVDALTATDVGADPAGTAASAVAAEAAARDSAIGAAVVGSTAAEFIRDTIGTALTAGARISVTVSDPGDTITIAVTGLTTSDLSDFATATDERARDALGAALTAGANITITPNDGADTITIAVSSLTSSSLSDFTEAVQDVVGAFVVGGTGLTATYSDVGNTLTLAVDTSAENERIDDRVAALLVAGNRITLTYDDSGNTLTIALSSAAQTEITDLQTQTALQAAQIEVRRLADLGQYVCSGCALTPNATPTKLDLAAGVVFMATTELNVAAQSAIATTIASLADSTNPKWVVVELDSGNVVQFNQGTAAASPAFPTITAARTPLGFLYVPANATNVDTLLTTNNGLAKLIDARDLRSVHPARLLFTDTAETVAALTVNSTGVSVLGSAYSIPANSLNVGDTVVLEASGSLKIAGASNSVVSIGIGPFASVSNITTAAQAFDATNSRRWTLRQVLTVVSIGSGTSAKCDVHIEFDLSAASASTPALSGVRYVGGAPGAGFDSTSALAYSLSFSLSAANASSSATLRQYSITKFPAQ